MPTQKRGSLDIDEDFSDLPQGTNYLLAIAVNAYQYAPKLSNCVGDAEAIIETLVSKYDFHKDNVITLFDDEATKANIDKKLRSLRSKIKKEDNLLLYFAGHGVYDKAGEAGYLIPVEAKPGEFTQFLSNADFLSLIRAIKSFHTFLLMDSCFSGSLFAKTRSLAEKVEHKRSRWGFAAGGIEEVEDGLHGENSPFVEAVLQYLEANTAPKFSVSSLMQNIRETVAGSVKQTPISGCLDRINDEGGEFVFRLKKDETADWNAASTTDTLAAYQVYLNTYPNGKYIASAKIAIKKISAANLWQKIENTPDESIYQIGQKVHLIDEFIKKYKTEIHYRQVLQEGKKMDWKQKFLAAKDSRYGLLDFIAENPPFFKTEAEELLAILENEGKDAEAERIRQEKIKKARLKEKTRLEKERRAEEARLKKEKAAIARKKKQQEKTKEASAVRIEKTIYVEKTGGIAHGHPSFIEKYSKWIGGAFVIILGVIMYTQIWTSGENKIDFNENMVLVKGGSFIMGCTGEQGDDCVMHERPEHEVVLDDFYLSKTEVTVRAFSGFINDSGYKTDAEKDGGSTIYKDEKWEKVAGVNWRHEVNGNKRNELEFNHTVIHVSWNDAVAYCEWFSKKTGENYRLPTEAEWEYAARGGNKSKTYKYSGRNNIDDVAWYKGNSDAKTHPVGRKQSNELNIYDMSGNVLEWCSDGYDYGYYDNSPKKNPEGLVGTNIRVLRGGSWFGSDYFSRVAFRFRNSSDYRSSIIGFRLARY